MRNASLLSGLCALLLMSCASSKPPAPDLATCKGLCSDGPLLAVSTVQLVEAGADGTVRGFDLDGVDGPAAFDCSAKDFISPEGTHGIDNQLAAILPVLKGLIGEALPTLLQNSVNDGGLSIILEFVGLDDPRNDDDVQLVFHRGQGTPLLDAEGNLLSGQTYDLAPEVPIGVCRHAKLVNGTLTCEHFDLKLTIVVFNVTYRLTVRDMRLTMQLADDLESASFLFGGSILVDDVIGIADTIGDISGLNQIIKDAVPPFADLVDPKTGACNGISGAIAMTARLGFVFE